jgi:hypothetical protein
MERALSQTRMYGERKININHEERSSETETWVPGATAGRGVSR